MVFNKKIQKIIRLFKGFCDDSIGNGFKALYLRGSYPRGDWIFGLSDLDFYVIVNDQMLHKATLKTKLDRELSDFLNTIRRTNPDLRISFNYDGKLKVLQEKCKSYITSQDSKLLFGVDVLNEVPEPKIIEIESYGKKMTVYLCDYWIQSSKNLKNQQTREDAVRTAQYMILKIAQNALFAKGILKFKKSKIVKEFEAEYHDFQLKNLVQEAYRIRSKWALMQKDRQKIDAFLERATYFPLCFKRYLINH